MVKIIFHKIILREIGDVGGLNMGDISGGQDSNVHCRRLDFWFLLAWRNEKKKTA